MEDAGWALPMPSPSFLEKSGSLEDCAEAAGGGLCLISWQQDGTLGSGPGSLALTRSQV